MMARSTTRSNQRPDTLMQDRICQVDETSCNARPDHTISMMPRSTTRSNQRPDTLMQDRICQVDETSCNARPDHTLGQTRKNSVRAYVFRFAPQTRTLLDTFGRASKFGSKKNPSRRYRVFFEVRADLAWIARSISGGGCCSPAIAHQTLT